MEEYPDAISHYGVSQLLGSCGYIPMNLTNYGSKTFPRIATTNVN